MLKYLHIVNEVLNNEVLPVLKEAVDNALTQQYGVNWYESFGEEILSSYKNYGDITEKMTVQHLSAIDSMDITAICFLLNPYTSEDNEQFRLYGAMDALVDCYGLTDREAHRIDRLRIIRNCCSHDKCDRDMKLNQLIIAEGEQEKRWISDIEDILKIFKPNINLFDYHKKLAHAVEENKKKGTEPLTSSAYIQEMELVRTAYRRIDRPEYSSAPIAEGLLGPAPWVSTNDDLADLPWTNLHSATVPPPIPSGQQNLVESVTSQLENGVNKVLGWFKGK